MSRLSRLKCASHGDDGKWAYEEIKRLRAENERLKAEVERILECNRLALERNDLFKKELAHWKETARCRLVDLEFFRAEREEYANEARRQMRHVDTVQKELAAMKSAQEPVAWMFTDNWGTHYTDDKRDWYDAVGIESVTPLYTHPAPRDEQVEDFSQGPVSRTAYNVTVTQLNCARLEARGLKEQVEALKRERDDLASLGQRIAMELECLLMDCKDNVVVSRWWDSAHEALEQWRTYEPRDN